MVTTTSACSASSRVRLRARGRRGRCQLAHDVATSGWTRSAGVVPADSARWRPPAARSNRAALICERPALWRQTNNAVAMGQAGSATGLRARTIAERALRVHAVRRADLDVGRVRRRRARRGTRPRSARRRCSRCRPPCRRVWRRPCPRRRSRRRPRSARRDAARARPRRAPCALSPERLITQLEITTSTDAVRQRDVLDVALDELGVPDPRLARRWRAPARASRRSCRARSRGRWRRRGGR